MENNEEINHPEHYIQRGIECFDVIEAMLGNTTINSQYTGKCTMAISNVQKYVFRHRFKKHPLKDLKKARVYLDIAIEEIEKQEQFIKDWVTEKKRNESNEHEEKKEEASSAAPVSDEAIAAEKKPNYIKASESRKKSVHVRNVVTGEERDFSSQMDAALFLGKTPSELSTILKIKNRIGDYELTVNDPKKSKDNISILSNQ